MTPRPLEEVARDVVDCPDISDELIDELREALAERDEWLAFCRRTLLKVPPIYINGR